MIRDIRTSAPIPTRPGYRPFCIVLRDRGPGRTTGLRYNTHIKYLDEMGGYSCGEYFSDLVNANLDFNQRVKDRS